LHAKGIAMGQSLIEEDMIGEVAKLEIPDIPVLPGGRRDLELKHEKPLPPGNYQAEAVVDLGRRELQGRKKPFTVGR